MSANFTATAEEFIEAARESGISEPVIRNVIRKLRRSSMKHVPLADFNLSEALISALKWKDIQTVEDLREYIELFGIEALKRTRNLGTARYNELKTVFPWIADFEAN